MTPEQMKQIKALLAEAGDYSIYPRRADGSLYYFLDGKTGDIKPALRAMLEENKRMREALEFYADFDPDREQGLYGYYVPDKDGVIRDDQSDFILDEGGMARQALGEKE